MNLVGDRTEKWDWIPIFGYLYTQVGGMMVPLPKNIQVGELAERKLPQVWIIVWICVCCVLRWPAIPSGVCSYFTPSVSARGFRSATTLTPMNINSGHCGHYGMVFHSTIISCILMFLSSTSHETTKQNTIQNGGKGSVHLSFLSSCFTPQVGFRVRNSCATPEMCYIRVDVLNITQRWKFFSRINTEDPQISVSVMSQIPKLVWNTSDLEFGSMS